MLLGLIGHKRVGKDTVAERLVNEHGFVRVAFADPIKQAALDTNPIIKQFTDVDGGEQEVRLQEEVSLQPHGWDGAKGVPEVRRFLQNFGVAIRNLDHDFWLRMATDKIREAEREGKDVVVTDVRFANEAQTIESRGGTTVRITRNTGTTDDHVSETELDEWVTHWTLHNGGTFEELYRTVDVMVEMTRNLQTGEGALL